MTDMLRVWRREELLSSPPPIPPPGPLLQGEADLQAELKGVLIPPPPNQVRVTR